MSTPIKVLVAPRDLVFLHLSPTSAADGKTPHVWELYALRHNTNISAEITHLFPQHHPHDDLPWDLMADYYNRVPHELQRTPVLEMKTVMRQVLRSRGIVDPPPLIVVSQPSRVMETHLKPYLPGDVGRLEFFELDPQTVDEVVEAESPLSGEALVLARIEAMQKILTEPQEAQS